MALDLDTFDEPVRYWLEQIEGAQKNCEAWYERGKGVLDRYLDKKDSAPLNQSVAHKMNTLWSNVQTIQPALYAKTPNPKVSRRYRDKDPVGKWTAIVLERGLGYTLDAYDVDYAVRAAVLDYLLPGRGAVWISYEPTFTAGPPDPATGKPTEQLAWEYCKTEHLNWKDFLHNQARTWDEVWWVAKRAWLTKEEVKAFPHFKGGAENKLTFTDLKDDDTTGNGAARLKKAAIWEVWCKPKGRVYYVSKNCPEMLGEREPTIQFEGFFPCPRPLTTTTTTDSIIPTPDFCQYQNQADEIDRLTQRINMLTKALRVVGIYDGSQENLSKLLEDQDQNKMVPVDNWNALAQQGGLKGSVDFLPLGEVVQALEQCYLSRDQAKQTMYEITGISDIVRGASDSRETATAQQIKSQWGSLRVRDRQAEVQRFVRDIMRLKSEIIAERFQLETLKAMTNCPILTGQEKQALQQRKQISAIAQQMQQADPAQVQAILAQNPQLIRIVQQVQANPQMAAPLTLDEEQKLREPTWEEVYGLLKDQKLRSFRIDIETDSTINANEAEEKQARIEFVTAATAFIQAWGPIIMQAPQMAPLAGAMLTFAARSFKQADSLETEIESMVDTMNQQALLPPQQQPADPKMEAEKEKMGFEREKHAQTAQFEQQKHQETMGLEREKFEDEKTFRREQAMLAAQEKLQTRQIEAQEKVGIAQTKQPKSEEILSAVSPFTKQVEQLMAGLTQQLQEALQMIAQSSQETQAQLVKAVQENQAQTEQAITQLVSIASAPKEITVQRDKQGRISGGTATPKVTMQ